LAGVGRPEPLEAFARRGPSWRSLAPRQGGRGVLPTLSYPTLPYWFPVGYPNLGLGSGWVFVGFLLGFWLGYRWVSVGFVFPLARTTSVRPVAPVGDQFRVVLGPLRYAQRRPGSFREPGLDQRRLERLGVVRRPADRFERDGRDVELDRPARLAVPPHPDDVQRSTFVAAEQIDQH